MVLETSLCDFKEFFLNGAYKRCTHILVQYMHSSDKENSIQGANKRCLKMKSDNIMDKCSSFVRWVIQQNIAVCEWMIYMLNSSCKDKEKNSVFQNRFSFELSQIHGLPAMKEHLSLEFVMLYNCLTINLVSSIQDTHLHTSCDRLWSLIYRSFERVQKMLEWETSELHDLKHRLVERPLFLKNIPLNGMSYLEKSSLFFLCFAIGWLAALQKNNSVLCAVLKAMKNIMKANQVQIPVKIMNHEKNLKLLCATDNPSVYIFPAHDMENLFSGCFALQQNNFDVALYYLNKVSLSEWVYFVLYAKAFIYYETNQYYLTIQCGLEFWEEKRHSEVQLASRFCNLLGCSYFMQNELLESQNWYRRAVDLDPNFDLPLYNLSIVLLLSNRMRDATEVLKGLTKKLYPFVSNSPTLFQFFMLKYQSEMVCIESHYFLAHHYVTLERYSEATIIFSKLLEFFQKNKLQIFGSYSCELVPNFLCLLYVEAAYAYLRSNCFSKCIETCDIVLRLIPVEPTKKSLLSDWVLDTTPLLPSREKVLCESADDVINDNKTEDDLSALNSTKNLENLGIFLQHKEEYNLVSERIHEDNFFYTVTLAIKSLAYQSVFNISKAINIMNRACTCGLELVTKKLNQSLKNKMLEQTIGSSTIHIGKNSFAKQHDMLNFVIEEKTSEANSSIDEVPHTEYKNNLYSAKNLKLHSSLEEIFLDDDVEIFQSFNASETHCVKELKNSNTDEKTLKSSSIISNEITLLSQIYNNLAILSIMSDQLKNADYYLKHATECMPGNIDAVYNYCLWELKSGNYDNAQSMWRTAKQKTPVINHVLDGSILPFPYSVTSEQVQTLNKVLIDLQDDACVEFDVDWDD